MVLTLVDDGFGSSEIRDKLVQGYASSPCLEGRSPFPYIPVAYSFYDEYLGVQKDPLGKTSEEYHVRQVIDYDTDGYYSEEISQVYYRVSDLVPVYTYNYDTNGSVKANEEWGEYLNGGLIEYKGTFTEKDFYVPWCTYAASNDFLE